MTVDDVCGTTNGLTLTDIGQGDYGADGSIQRLPNGGLWTFTPGAMTPGESNTATPVTGACCEALGGCTDTVTQATCLAGGGTWFEAQECLAVTCPAPKGACCLPDGDCMDLATSNGCADNCFDAAFHPGDLCSTAGCTPLPVGQCCMYIGECIDVAECECFDPDGGVLSGNWDGQATCITAECEVLGSVAINEIRIDQPGTDYDEYFELVGTGNMSLNGLTYLVIGDGAGGSGTIEAAIDLHNQVISSDGFFLAAEDNSTYGAAADMITDLNFENSDNVTHLLVAGFTGQVGDDLDLDVNTQGGDGILDITPWAAIVDSVALIKTDPPVGPLEEYVYSDTKVGPDCVFVPGHVYRLPDATGDWQIGAYAGSYDTPDATNAGAGPMTGARSWRDHGTAKAFTARPIDLIVSPVEPRLGGVLKVEIDLDQTVTTMSASVCCLGVIYEGVVTATPDGNQVTVDFSEALPQQDCCVITLSGDVNARLPVTMLVGDTNRDAGIDTSDSSSVKARLGQPMSDANAPYDVDTDDAITTADKSSVKARLGNLAPICP